MRTALRHVFVMLVILCLSLQLAAQVTTATLPVGKHPEAAAVNASTNRIFVANGQCDTDPCSTLGTVTVIDGATNNTVGTVNVGYSPGAVVVNPVTNKVYVGNICGNDPTCQSPGTITVIDGATLQTSTVQVGFAPGVSIHSIAVNSITNQIYVANHCLGTGWPGCTICNTQNPNGTITAIDGATLATHTVFVGCGPENISVNPQTNTIYVVNLRALGLQHGTVTVVDGATLATQTVDTDSFSYDIAADSVRNKVYVTNLCGTDPTCVSDGSLTVIDGSTLSTQSVPAGHEPYWVAVNPVTNHIYTANPCGNSDCSAKPTVGDFDGGTLAATFLSVCEAAQSTADLEVNTTTNKIYIPCVSSGTPPAATVVALDGATDTIFPIAVGDQPISTAALNTTTNTIYVPNFADNTVSVVGAATKLQLNAVTPCRLIDTRSTSPIQGGTAESFNLPQLAQANCPGLDLSKAASYSLNVTLLPDQGHRVGYLTIWPTSQIQPTVSTMNSDGRNKANAAIVSAGVAGAVSVYVANTANIILDIDGYFGPAKQSTLQFYPLPPCRVADTRSTNEPPGLGAPSLAAGQPRSFPLLNAASCFRSGLNPSAYSLNFTAVPHGVDLRYLTVWPSGENQPNVSTLNAPTGVNTANAAIVPAGTGAGVTVFASDNTDLLIDVNGYFAPAGQGGLSLYPTPPCRVLDTRPPGGNGAFSGTLNPPVDVVASPCGVPSQSQAYTLNATAVPDGPLGYLTLWPYEETQPVVSTLNASDGALTSNMAIVPAGSQGKINAFAGNGTTNLILDVSAVFAP